MGAWFPKDKEGEIFNLWGQWRKAKCQWENPSNSQLPFLFHSPNHLIMPEIGWSSYCMGMGRVWARKFEFRGIPIFEKNVFDFWGKLAPKMHAHLVIHPCSPFSSCSEAWDLFLPSCFAHFPHLACPEIRFWCCSTSGQGTFSFWEFMVVILAPVMP